MNNLDTTRRDYIKNINKVLKQEIYRNTQKRKQDQINNELNKLKFNELANKNNINQDDLIEIKQYNFLNIKTLQKIAQQRNINATNLKKKDLTHTRIRSEKSHKEDNYIKYINKDTNKGVHYKINEIRLLLVNISSYLKKQELNQIRKRLYEIENKTKINRTEKTKLLNELSDLSIYQY